jgi:hypothetical protein
MTSNAIGSFGINGTKRGVMVGIVICHMAMRRFG